MELKTVKRLYICNLSLQATEEDLKKLFSQFGQVISIEIPKEQNTNRPQGYAYIEFASSESVDKAIEALNEKEFKGRLLSVKREEHKRCRGRW